MDQFGQFRYNMATTINTLDPILSRPLRIIARTNVDYIYMLSATHTKEFTFSLTQGDPDTIIEMPFQWFGCEARYQIGLIVTAAANLSSIDVDIDTSIYREDTGADYDFPQLNALQSELVPAGLVSNDPSTYEIYETAEVTIPEQDGSSNELVPEMGVSDPPQGYFQLTLTANSLGATSLFAGLGRIEILPQIPSATPEV